MNAICRKCGAHVPEEEAFCLKCGAVMESEMSARTDDASWDIPDTFIGKKQSDAKSKAASSIAASNVADAPTRVPEKAQVRPPARTAAPAISRSPQQQPDATRNSSKKFTIMAIIAVLVICVMLVLFVSRS